MVIPRALKKSTVAKRLGTPVYQALARSVVWLPGPRILANSFPKAGTHVLSTLLSAMPKTMFSGRHYNINQFRLSGEQDLSPDAEFRWDEVARRYGLVRPGQFATGHFPPHSDLLAIVRDLDMRTIVIFRDPRDIVVSTAYYIRSLKRHPLHDVFRSFSSTEEAIAAVISGTGPDDHGRVLLPIADRLAAFLPWLDCPDVLTVRFEDLVGEHGGGSREEQVEAVAAISRHIDRPLQGKALTDVCDRIFSADSATFRKGQIGDWRNHLTPAQADHFTAESNRFLVRLGYESSPDW